MAQIKYLDSRRIMGASNDIVENLNYVDENYSSSTGWTQVSTNIAISNGKVQFSSGVTATSRIYKALPFTADNTKWIIDFELLYSTAANGDQLAPLCISDGTDHPTGSATNSICVHSYHNGAGVTNDTVSVSYRDGGSLTNVFSLATNLTNGTRYYMRLERTSSTNVKLTAYSNSARTSSVTSNNGTIPSTLDGLTTIHHSSHHTTGANQTAEIDNLKFYDGVTGTPFTVTNKPSLVTTTGGWVEVGRKTISSPTADDLTITGLPNKKYFMILLNNPNMTNDISGYLRVGNGSVDTTAGNYSTRYYDPQLGYDSTYAGNVQGFYPVGGSGSAGTTNFGVGYMANKSDQYKMLLLHTVSSSTSAINPIEMVGKWLNSSQLIERISEVNGSTGEYNAGCELIVLAYDPDDTHTTNFWEQLADVTASGSSSNLSSGTITAKKYLWIQAYVEPASSTDFVMTFNNDNATSNGNYDIQVSDNGGTYGTSYGRDNINLKASMTTPTFINLFIVNNSTTKKLCIGNAVEQNTAGANSVPNRRESVGRWNNTSAQITEIDIDSSGGNWGSNSFIRVWGSD